MAVNKVVYGTTVLVDLTSDTVTADTLKKGSTAHNSAGELITGTMPTATQATPTISVSSGGLITASSTQSAGYVEAGTKSATKQLTVQAAKTITPSTSSQTAVASGVYTTGAITVAAIPSSYVEPAAIKDAATYTPTTSNQTITAGTYCSGAQTIKGDTNLVADNIKNGVSIFGVNGTYEGSGGGSTETIDIEITTEICFSPMGDRCPTDYIAYLSIENGQIVLKQEDAFSWATRPTVGEQWFTPTRTIKVIPNTQIVFYSMSMMFSGYGKGFEASDGITITSLGDDFEQSVNIAVVTASGYIIASMI